MISEQYVWFLVCFEDLCLFFGGGHSGADGGENDDDAGGGSSNGSGCDYGDGGDGYGVDVGGGWGGACNQGVAAAAAAVDNKGRHV